VVYGDAVTLIPRNANGEWQIIMNHMAEQSLYLIYCRYKCQEIFGHQVLQHGLTPRASPEKG